MSAPGSLPAKKTILGAVCGPVEVPTSGGPEGPGNQFWSSKPGVCHVQKPIPLTARAGLSRGPLAQAMEAHFERPRSDRGAGQQVRQRMSGAQQIMAWVERELQVLGQNGSVPQQDRVRVFKEAFGAAAAKSAPQRRALLDLFSLPAEVRWLAKDLRGIATP
ncbi:hypothetical protein AK812_SmicGene42456 [Symbiodinium microadriaticum]|uniref:Uncharacterized protein n=1 Tax=Symbiodinium microadriaticum TaxID=2951 RepID=A0A1Q9C3I1_SYMMI|nr:hypothetical protein AK812_SmicGene42456 [Symbiodinium microadriaticum]